MLLARSRVSAAVRRARHINQLWGGCGMSSGPQRGLRAVLPRESQFNRISYQNAALAV